jgi:hypothetical protein
MLDKRNVLSYVIFILHYFCDLFSNAVFTLDYITSNVRVTNE